MRFMMIVKATKDSEAGKLPGDERIATMGKYNEELFRAGVLVDLNGLHSSAKGFRVRCTPTGERTVIDGPFPETKELVAGYWIINVKSREEAVAWAKRVPPPHGPEEAYELEIRQVFELEDFKPSDTIERIKTLREERAASQRAGD